jgi:membrane protein YqaA with SNARE-associated domain
VLRALYNWTLKQAAGRHADKGLALIAFSEASVFPIPPDIMLAPMVLAKPKRAYYYATICTLASVAGALAGYMIGYFLTPLGLAILNFFGYQKGLEQFHAFMEQWGVWVILIKGLLPIPFKLVTIASGLAHMNILAFVLSCAATRGARFFLVAWLVKRFGPEITKLIEKRLYLVSGIVLGLIVLAVILLKFMPH